MASANPEHAAALSGDARDIVIARRIGAPRELVFAAFTEARHVAHWWGPNGFSLTTASMDARPGGMWRFVMHGPNGVDYPNRIDFIEVIAPSRLSYRHSHDGGADGMAFHVVVTFEALDGGQATLVTMHSRFDSAAARDLVVREFGAIEGGNQTLARLDQYLAAGHVAA